jgi:hypothetical protein
MIEILGTPDALVTDDEAYSLSLSVHSWRCCGSRPRPRRLRRPGRGLTFGVVRETRSPHKERFSSNHWSERNLAGQGHVGDVVQHGVEQMPE